MLRVSYMEIYNEIVNDLLAPEGTNLTIREDKKVRCLCWRHGPSCYTIASLLLTPINTLISGEFL
jgi:hypothetical protein